MFLFSGILSFFSYTMNRFLCFLFSIFVFIGSVHASLSNEKDIMRLFYKGTHLNEWDFLAFSYLITSDEELYTYSDSAQYCYHYLFVGMLDEDDDVKIDLQNFHLDKAIHICETQIGIFSLDYIELLTKRGQNAEEQGDIDGAISYLQQALVKGGFLLLRESTMRNRFAKGNILDDLGELYLKKGYEREAIQCFRQAHEIMKQDYSEENITAMMPLFHLGCYYDFNKKEHDKAVAVWTELLRCMENNGIYSGKYYNDWTFQLICNIAKSGDKETAYKKYKELIERIRDEFGYYSEHLDGVYGNYFIILGELGYMSELEEFKPLLRDYYAQRGTPEEYSKALYAVSTVIKNSNNKNAISIEALELKELSLSKRMLLLFNLGMDENTSCKDAIDFLQQALVLAEELNNGRMNEDCKFIIEWLSFRYNDNKEYEKAKEANKELLLILEAIGEQTSDNYFYALHRLTYIYFELEEYSQIILNEEKRVVFLLNKFGKNSLEIASCYNNLAISHLYLGNYRKAKFFFNNSIRIWQNQTDKNSDIYNEAYSTHLHNIGRLFMLQKKFVKAKECFTESINLSLKTTGKVNPKTERYLNEIDSKEL